MLRSVPRALLCCWGFGCKCRLEAWAPQRGEDSPAFQSACSRAWPQDLGTRNDSVTAACGPGPGGRTDRGARVAAPRSVGVSFFGDVEHFFAATAPVCLSGQGTAGQTGPVLGQRAAPACWQQSPVIAVRPPRPLRGSNSAVFSESGLVCGL